MNILIIQTAFIGDLILTTPLFREIANRYGKCNLYAIVNKGTELILEGNPYISKIIGFDKKMVKSSPFYFFSFILEIRKLKPDICISPHFSHRSSLISFFSGAKIRIGYKESGFSFLHTKKIKRPIKKVHEVDKLFSLVTDDKIIEPRLRRPELYLKEEDIAIGNSILSEQNLKLKDYILVSPSSVWETKRMPSEKFVELIQKIISNTNYNILLAGSKSDMPLTSKIKNNFSERVFDISGKTNLGQLSYIISQSIAVVSNDSSPIHFASAHNIPTVAIFGATVPDFGYTPLSDKYFISEIPGLECRPCGIHGGNHCPKLHFKCMNNQDTNTILNELLKLTIPG